MKGNWLGNGNAAEILYLTISQQVSHEVRNIFPLMLWSNDTVKFVVAGNNTPTYNNSVRNNNAIIMQ